MAGTPAHTFDAGIVVSNGSGSNVDGGVAHPQTTIPGIPVNTNTSVVNYSEAGPWTLFDYADENGKELPFNPTYAVWTYGPSSYPKTISVLIQLFETGTECVDVGNPWSQEHARHISITLYFPVDPSVPYPQNQTLKTPFFRFGQPVPGTTAASFGNILYNVGTENSATDWGYTWLSALPKGPNQDIAGSYTVGFKSMTGVGSFTANYCDSLL